MKYFIGIFGLIAIVVLMMQTQPHGTQADAHAKTPGGNFSIVGPPTISASFINQVLAEHNSPAQGLGQTFYDLGVQYGIDPAFALAFFGHESSFGTVGVAVMNRSIGNVRCLVGYPCRDGFAWFPSWGEGIKAWYRLIAGPLYVGSGLTTLPAIIHRYAPSADNNDESAYVQAVSQAVSVWRAQQ